MRTKKKIALPVEYRTTTVMRCDACGTEVGIETGAVLMEWTNVSTQVESKEDPRGIGFEDDFDFCPKCAPKIKKVLTAEVKSISAETVAAVAEAVGVT